MNEIVESCRFVAKHSEHVKIHSEKIQEFAEYFDHSHIKHWIDDAPFDLKQLSREDRLHFLLVFNAISFSYWGEPKWKIVYNGDEVDGAYGMICAIARSVEKGIPILDPYFLSQMSEEEFSRVLEGNVEIPLFQERYHILQNVGKTLLEKFDGKFSNVVEQAGGDAQKFLNLLVKHFPSFEDMSEYHGKQVFFFKRAQLLIADIYQAFSDFQYGKWGNIDMLTACADYKLPFVMRRLGILSYSDSLTKKIDGRVELVHGSQEEVELRACTIWAVEMIKKQVQKKIPEVDSIHVNDHIWVLGQEKYKDDKPYHLTRTIAY
ncbi:hypothetical protein H6758_00880 [Candidatus Nomurabacteria bacterium]|nr:hypothetical protein [Candidatus Nomurabacteria bacterium]